MFCNITRAYRATDKFVQANKSTEKLAKQFSGYNRL